MKRFYIIFILATFAFSSLFLLAQDNRRGGSNSNTGGSNNRNTSTPAPKEDDTNTEESLAKRRNRRKPLAPSESEKPIEGFNDIKLGTSKQATIDVLKDSAIINLPRKYQELDISEETAGNFISIEENKYFKSGYFLFKDDALYSITLRFQDNQVDFLDLLEALNEKYGTGSFMDANTVAWENARTQLILERPATIKYMRTEVARDVRVNYTNNIITNSVDITEGL